MLVQKVPIVYKTRVTLFCKNEIFDFLLSSEMQFELNSKRKKTQLWKKII